MRDNDMRFAAVFIVFAFSFIFYDGCRRLRAEGEKCKIAGGQLIRISNYRLCISNKIILPIGGGL